jgi:hypothetical protein
MSGGAAGGMKPGGASVGKKLASASTVSKIPEFDIDFMLRLMLIDDLQMSHPDTWAGKDFSKVQIDWPVLLEQIRETTGLTYRASRNSTCTDELIQKFDAFSKKYGSKDPLTRFFMVHGTSFQAAQNICLNGMNPDKFRCGLYGRGSYVTDRITCALPYVECQQLVSGRFLCHFVCGLAEFGTVYAEVPVGSKNQTDFGLLKNGRENFTLRNPEATYWCLRRPEQYRPVGILTFQIDTKELPSDYALRHMIFPQEVWDSLKENHPGIVARKEKLRKWFGAVGSRRQPPRGSKTPGGGKASRFKPY